VQHRRSPHSPHGVSLGALGQPGEIGSQQRPSARVRHYARGILVFRAISAVEKDHRRALAIGALWCQGAELPTHLLGQHRSFEPSPAG
jgi:hypothetical protein